MSDLEFVQHCIKGDKLAWDQFLSKYSRLIYNYIYSILKIKGYTLAQEHINDIFQEIFILLTKDNYNKLKTFKAKNGCSLASWLRQVTVNFSIDYLRKLRSTVSLEEENEEDLSLKEVLPDNSPLAHNALLQKEKLNNLKDCIKALPRDERYFLELHINQGLNLEELRIHYKISRGAVDMRKARILEKLKDCFRKKGFTLDV